MQRKISLCAPECFSSWISWVLLIIWSLLVTFVHLACISMLVQNFHSCESVGLVSQNLLLLLSFTLKKLKKVVIMIRIHWVNWILLAMWWKCVDYLNIQQLANCDFVFDFVIAQCEQTLIAVRVFRNLKSVRVVYFPLQKMLLWLIVAIFKLNISFISK